MFSTQKQRKFCFPFFQNTKSSFFEENFKFFFFVFAILTYPEADFMNTAQDNLRLMTKFYASKSFSKFMRTLQNRSTQNF